MLRLLTACVLTLIRLEFYRQKFLHTYTTPSPIHTHVPQTYKLRFVVTTARTSNPAHGTEIRKVTSEDWMSGHP